MITLPVIRPDNVDFAHPSTRWRWVAERDWDGMHYVAVLWPGETEEVYVAHEDFDEALKLAQQEALKRLMRL